MTIHQEEDNLHLPRILCLHGGGTNARIFKMQCRVLERSLHSTFRLVYADAPFPAQPGSDVTSVYKNHGPFKAWLRCTPADDARSPQDVIDAINASIATAMYHDAMCGATVPWVGLLGFSQGAKVAASVLFAQQSLHRRFGPDEVVWPSFRFAVLMAGRGPLVWLLPEKVMRMPRGLVDAAQPSILPETAELVPRDSDEHVLCVSTIHLHGLRDPGLERHRRLLADYCDPGAASLLEWDGEHRVPIKRKDVDALVALIYTVARNSGVLFS